MREKVFLLRTLTVYIGLVLSTGALALVPMESLVLGDLSEFYTQEKVDPLNYVFTLTEKLEKLTTKEQLSAFKRNLALYRGFGQEGENLTNFCRRRPEAAYATRFDKEQALRSVIASVQYLMLDLSVRSLASYAQELKFTPSEFENMSRNMIGSYCSKNLSIISLSQLEKVMMARFSGESGLSLPTLEGNPLFTDAVANRVQDRGLREKELIQSLRLFKTACSWGGETDNTRLLPPILRDASLMAFVFRQLSSKKMEWRERDNRLLIVEDPDSIHVNCTNLICRRVSRRQFENQFPRQVGSISVEDDLRRLYCSEFRDAEYSYRDQVPELQDLMQKMSFDEQNLLVGHVVSLLSGIPDFFLYGESFQDLRGLARSSMDRVWDLWAYEQLEVLDNNLLYEEPLTIELVDFRLFFNPFRPDFKVVLDVNMGEYDRINQRVGKLSSHFYLRLPRSFMIWVDQQWNSEHPNLAVLREDIQKRFELMIKDQVEQARQKFSLPPWNVGIESLIVREIVEQMSLYQGKDPFGKEAKGEVRIPVEVNFGLFALKYMRYRYQIEQNKEREERFRETHEKMRTERVGLSTNNQ